MITATPRLSMSDRLRQLKATLAVDPAIRHAAAIVISLRVALGVFAWLSLMRYPNPTRSGDWNELLLPKTSPLWTLVGPWQRWDALWYQHLATHGYQAGTTDGAFYPLFPLLTHVIGVPLLGNYALAGLLVSTLAFFGALVAIHRLVAQDFDTEVARRATIYIAIAPAAFFFLASYAESTYLLFSAAAILMARRQRFVSAGLLAGLAAASRLPGVILLVPLLVEVVVEMRRRSRLQQPVFAIRYLGILVPVGVVVLNQLFIRIVAPFPEGASLLSGNDFWHHAAVAPWTVLIDSFRAVAPGDNSLELLNLVSVVGVIVSLPFMISRLPWSYIAYTAAMLVPLLTQEGGSPLDGALRHTVVIFPVFVLLAILGRRTWVDRMTLIVFPMIMALLFFDFVQFGYVG